ncbi:MAG TPA: trypsin-like peptidase domain-containing protein [Dermatophilaceae bacterium]|nr:trypsin-like peptidase domain-containing protein [Dermatophilaceae bacterium]
MSDEPKTPHPPVPEHPGSTEETGVIDVNSTQEVPTAPARPWFDEMAERSHARGVPGAAGAPAPAAAPWPPPEGRPHGYEPVPAAHSAPAQPAAASTEQSPMGAVQYPVAVPGSSHPAPVAEAPRKRRRVAFWAAIVALCLLSGLVGGVAGQLVTDRANLAGAELPAPGPGATERPAGSVANIAATVLPSVVTIKVQGGDDEGTGSGFVIDTKGHILTNNHVVGAAADGGEIEVVLSNGDTEPATIVGRDVSYDLAVLKIRRTDLKPLVLGQSEKIVVGDQVIAVGAPLGLEQTVTTGIISALNRPVSPGVGDEASYMNAIQTDAAINPGNSGGPLLDLKGQVIGVNSAIARVPGTSGSTGGNIGLGFAIPSDQARRTAEQLIKTGKATHPVIGVMLDRTYSGEGAQVIDQSDAVTPSGPAAKAGIRPGDIIVAFEGKRVRTPDALIVAIRARAVGDTVTLTVERDGKEIELKMVLEADPKG